MTPKPRSAEYLGISMEDTCLPSMRCPVQRRRDSHSGFRAEPGNLLEDERENVQAQKRKAESTNASIRGGPPRSSDEAAVIAVERRGWAVQSKLGQPVTGGTLLLG